MPYANPERQKQYQRIYMKRRRKVNSLARLLARRDYLVKQYEVEPILKHFDPEREGLARLDAQIQIKYDAVQQLTGLLQIQTNSIKSGVEGKPLEMSQNASLSGEGEP